MNLHFVIHCWPHPFPDQSSREVNGRELKILEFENQSLGDTFPVTFDEFLPALESEFAAYTEGDGSFGFSMQKDGSILKAAGTVVDQGGQVGCLDLWLENGSAELVRRLFQRLNVEADQCVIQLLEQGCTVSGAAFCEWLG